MPDPTLNIAGASQYALAQNQAVKPPAPVAPVEETQTGEASIDLSHRGKPQSGGTERRHFDESTIAGPPPTFEASLLELERDIDLALKRLEARRDQGYESGKTANIANNQTTHPEANDAKVPSHEQQSATAPESALANGNETNASGAEAP